MHPSQAFFVSGIGFLCGVALSLLLPSDFIFVTLLFGIIGIAVFTIFRSFIFLKAFTFFFFFFLLGIGRVLSTQAALPDISEHSTSFRGIIASEIDQRLDHTKITVTSNAIPGRILINAPLYPEYHYGDELAVECILQRPEPIDDFRYDRYLELSGTYWTCSNANIQYLGSGHGFFLKGYLLTWKTIFLSQINKIIHEPQASFLAGLLLGVRRGFTQDLLDNFQRTGTTHILAISGYNITLIITLLLNMFIGFGLKRQYAFWFIIIGVVTFIFVTGASASVVRAGIMGIFVLLARQWGRLSSIRQVLLGTAVLMVAYKPQTLVYDAGFQLSFASTLGLIYLSPHLERYVHFFPESFGLRENSSSTLAAIFSTLPLSLFQFHGISFSAFFTNLLVLPLVPLAMGVGFFAVVLSFFSLSYGRIFAWMPWLILEYIIRVLSFFSKFRWSYISTYFIPWQWMAAVYVFFCWWIWVKVRHTKNSTC